MDREIEQETPDEAAISALVTRWIAAFNAHDVEQITALYAQDAELYDTGMKHARKGHDEIRSWFTGRFQQMSTIQYVQTRSFFSQQTAAICWLAQGKTPPLLRQNWLSRPFKVEGVSIFLTQAGLIYWQHGYYDHLQVVGEILPFIKWLPLKL